MDGTLIELGITPSCLDASDYHGRKLQWSLPLLFLNDLNRKIQYYLVGLPGSAHNNRVWRNSKPYRNLEEHFGPTEYVICDTAFDPSPFCIPAFTADVGFSQSPDKQLFNITLSKPRVSLEHTIGILKGHFPGAWQKITLLLTNEKKLMKRILMYIDAAIVLHNILFELKDGVCSEWDCYNDVTVIDDPNSVEKNWRSSGCLNAFQRVHQRGGEEINLKLISMKQKFPNLMLQFLIMYMV